MAMDFKRLSILPAMILVAMLAFSVRIVDVYTGVSSLRSSAFAASEDKPVPQSEAPTEEGALEAAAADETTTVAQTSEGQEAKAVEKPENLNKWRDSIEEDFGYNSLKIENLQNLEERRQELDKREKNLQAKEAMIKAAQQEMGRKYKELTQLRTQIEGLLDKQKDEEQAQIKSLVTIYEGMKAKEAAAIFNTLDLDILVEVIRNMSERKASPILAKMTAERAKTVTIMLAEQKSLPDLPAQ